MITIENKENNIYLFGRRDEKSYIKKCTKFKPYFYVEDSKNGEFTAIDGKKVKKIFPAKVSDVKKERENYMDCYEADVVYTNRYIIDNFKIIEKEKIRIAYIDIEVMETEKGYESPEVASNPINCIGCYDNFTKEYVQFILGKNCNTEKEVLEKFIDYINKTDPDIITAWNGDGFDFPLLINKIKKFKLPTIARLGESSYTRKMKLSNVFKTHIFGRVCFDLMEAYKKMHSYEGRESWSLDYISKYELGNTGGKEECKGGLDDLYNNDIEKFILYNKRDVELLVLLDEKLGIIDFFDEVRRLCFCKFEDVFKNSKIADCLCLKSVQGKLILPSTKENEKEAFQGAFVHETEAKLHTNIAVMDMKSLYPSVMIGFNVSYETILDKAEENCISIDNKYFFKKKEGIIPSIVKPLLEKRKEVASKMIGLDKNSTEYKSLWVNQYALKVIANSFYGVLGMKYFRLYKNECASAITYISRRIIKEVHRWFEDKGFKVIYGDTDSIFLEMGEHTLEETIELNKEINLYFKDYFKQFGVEDKNNIFKLEFEKVFSKIFFKRKSDGLGAKKKYCGVVIWEN